jgi:hypothetical protein
VAVLGGRGDILVPVDERHLVAERLRVRDIDLLGLARALPE